MTGHRIRALAGVVLAGASLALAACTSSSSGQSSGQNAVQTPVKNGTIVVKSGNRVICTMTVVNGKGTCTVPSQSLGVGTQQFVAHYSGQGYRDAQSNPVTFTVIAKK
jgi:hypothetical protein